MTACIIVSPFGMPVDSIPGGTQYVLRNIKFESLSDMHKLKITEYLDSIDEDDLSKKIRLRSAFVVPVSEFGSLKDSSAGMFADYCLQIHRFSLEQFVNIQVPMAAVSFDGEKVTGVFYDKTDLFRDLVEFKLPDGAWSSNIKYLEFIYKNIDKSPLAKISITRLSRANKSGPSDDGIIDLAVALEALVAAQSEIKYQFSLHHALLNGKDLVERISVFDRLKDLYDIRSKIVHGGELGSGEKRKMVSIKDGWQDLLRIARANITYYMLFCGSNDYRLWPNHVRDLAFGANRLTSEVQT